MAREELELLSRWSTIGDARAFNELVTEYSSLVYATCKRILRTHAEAEEAAQECFIKLAQTPPDIDRSLGAWLHTVATNVSVSRVRSESRRKAREQRFAQQLQIRTEPVWEDVQELVDEAIEDLPEELRDAVVGSFLERKTHAEIADANGIDRSTVTRRIDRGVEKIREALSRKGLSTLPAVLPGWFDTELLIPVPSSLSAKLGKIAIAGGHVRAGVADARQTAPSGPGAGAFTVGAAGTAIVAVAALVLWFGTDLFDRFSTTPTDEAAVLSGVANAPTDTSLRSTEPAFDLADGDNAPLDSAVAHPGSEADEAAASDMSGALISGEVIARADGEPVPDVAITAVLTGQNDDNTIEVKTGFDGAFAFDNLPLGDYQVRCELPEGYKQVAGEGGSRRVVLVQDGQNVKDLDFELSRGGILEGYVIALGEPLRNEMIRVRSYGSHTEVGDTGLIPHEIETDSRGRFRVEGLEEFDGSLNALRRRPDGSLQEALSVPVKVRYDEVLEGTFDFVGGTASIEGTVTRTHGDMSVPLAARVQVYFTWLENGEYTEESYRMNTDEQGRFFFSGLPAGYAKIHCWERGTVERGAHVKAFRLDEGQHKVQDIQFSDHVLRWSLTNIPEWAVEVMIAFFPKDYVSKFNSMQGYVEDRENMVLHERVKSVNSSSVVRELQGLQPGTYNVTVMIWPVHYNAAAVEEFGGPQKVIEKMININDTLTIGEGSYTGELAIDVAAGR